MRRLHARPVLLAAIAVAATIGVSACGSGSGSGSATVAAATTSGAASSTAASTPSTAATSSAPSAAGGDATEFCALAEEQAKSLAGTDLSKLIVSSTPAGWRAYFTRKAAENAALVAAAPAQLRPAIDTIEVVTGALQAELAKADYDFTKVNLRAFLKAIRDPKFTAASATLKAYLKSTCNVQLPSA